MRVMTFNIQHCHHWPMNQIDIPVFAHTVDRLGADVCGLNEVRGRGALAGYSDQLGKMSKILGWEKYFGMTIKVGGVGPYGNGLLTKYPIISAETHHIPDPDEIQADSNNEHRGFIKAVIDAEGRELTVIVCHMGLSRAEQENAVASLCTVIDGIDTPLIVMGDFNTTPDSGILDPLFERMSDTNDVSVNPDVFTNPSYAPDKKIDYVLYRGLVCKHAETVTEVVSDHFPIVADFDFNG